MTGTAAAAQSSSTFRTAASTWRSGIASSATTTVAISRCPSHRRTPAPAFASPDAAAVLTSLATAICSAEPGTIRMMKADSRAASEP